MRARVLASHVVVTLKLSAATPVILVDTGYSMPRSVVVLSAEPTSPSMPTTHCGAICQLKPEYRLPRSAVPLNGWPVTHPPNGTKNAHVAATPPKPLFVSSLTLTSDWVERRPTPRPT